MALTADRDTPEKKGHVRNFGLAAAKKIYAGALVMLDNAGHATPGAASTTSRGAGRARTQVDNSAGSAGDQTIDVEIGIFRFDNSASGDLIAAANIGSSCYIVDDHTVAKTDGSASRSIAGTIHDVDAIGVWVKFT